MVIDAHAIAQGLTFEENWPLLPKAICDRVSRKGKIGSHTQTGA